MFARHWKRVATLGHLRLPSRVCVQDPWLQSPTKPFALHPQKLHASRKGISFAGICFATTSRDVCVKSNSFVPNTLRANSLLRLDVLSAQRRVRPGPCRDPRDE